MKTAISLPDDLFAEADRLARRLRKSRSQLYSQALAEFIARHSPDEITSAMNRVVDAVDEPRDPVLRAASIRLLRKVDW